jgi:ribosomal protein L18E
MASQVKDDLAKHSFAEAARKWRDLASYLEKRERDRNQPPQSN